MAQEQPPAQTPSPPSGRFRQFTLLVVIVLIGQIGIGYWTVHHWLLPKLKAEESGASEEGKIEGEKGGAAVEEKAGEGEGGKEGGGEKKEGGEGGRVKGDLLDVGKVTASTIQGGELHYVILDAKIKFDSNKGAEEAGKNLSRVKDSILRTISRKPGEELDDVQDQDRLREEIKQAINARVTSGKAEEVYFTQYVYQ